MLQVSHGDYCDAESTYVTIYHSLMKECSRAEHLTSLPKRGVGALSSGSTFKTK